MSEVKQFNRKKELEWIPIELDGETFFISAVAPAMAILDVSAVNKAEDMEKIRVIFEFLDKVMDRDSAERFAARLRSSENPIEIDQATSVVTWAMEEVYGKGADRNFPTPAPSPLHNGRVTTGTSSSDGPSPTVSTSES